MLEQAIVSGVAHDTGEAKVTIVGVPDQPGVAARVFRPLADAGINIDMIVQNISAPRGTRTSASRSRPSTPSGPSRSCAELADEVGAASFGIDPDIAKVSVIGAGMRSHPGVAADIFAAARRRQDQHGDHLHVGDPRLVRRAAPTRRSAP